MRKFGIAIASVLVVALVAGGITLFAMLRRPLPAHTGEQTVQGLAASVEILRDDHGIPQIYATTSTDLFFAQGYVHAQDRFFEMDYRRHVTSGRLSELVGENASALAADKVIRTLGWRMVAEQEWDLLSSEAQDYYRAYAEGVNAYLDGRNPHQLALEYTVLGLQVDLPKIEPWDPIDSLAWLKAMAWDMAGNHEREIARVAAYDSVEDLELVNQIFPAQDSQRFLPILPTDEEIELHYEFVESGGDSPLGEDESETEDPQGDALTPPNSDFDWATVSAALNAVPTMLGQGDGIGSNSWVIAGEHTESGSPLLGNDPHLGLDQPGIWYQAGLHCVELNDQCSFDVSGFSFAGMPGIIIGHNQELGWGLTNMGSDAIDLFLHRVYLDGTYLRDGERISLDTREEVIKVNGSEDVTITVKSTVHGPIVSDVLGNTAIASHSPVGDDAPYAGADGYAVAMAWTALKPGRTGEAVFAINTARNAAEIAAAATLFEVPTQNIVFATTAGDIGYQAPGLIPIRNEVPDSPVPSDGTWPRPGWDSQYDWQGFVPPSEMPRALNPEEGFIITANQMVQSADQEPFLSVDTDYGQRAHAIRLAVEAQIAEGKPFSVADMNDLHLIEHNPFAELLVPVLLDIPIEDDFIGDAVKLLEDWDLNNSVDSAAAAYFEAVWVNILEGTFWDQLPASQHPRGGSQWLEAIRVLLKDPENPWWDDATTVNVVEQRDEILEDALVSAREQLTVRLGKDPASWKWGDLHQIEPQHALLGGEGIPGIVRTLVNGAAKPVAGGSAIVNANGYNAAARINSSDGDYPDFSVLTGASMRAAYDLSNWDNSTWVSSTGNSGHPVSSNYTNQYGAWATGKTFPWAYSRAAVEQLDSDRLVLQPQ